MHVRVSSLHLIIVCVWNAREETVWNCVRGKKMAKEVIHHVAIVYCQQANTLVSYIYDMYHVCT